jgi:bacillithiol system protein YtxJ
MEDFTNLISLSFSKPVLILKHSTKCGTSRFALKQLESDWKTEDENKLIPFFLDLLSHRDVSNAIEKQFSIQHESPQVLLVRNGNCFYSASHDEIDYSEIMKKISLQ